MICSLIIAWFLSLFNFDEIFITAIKEIFNFEITTATYYFVFFCIGVIYEIFK